MKLKQLGSLVLSTLFLSIAVSFSVSAEVEGVYKEGCPEEAKAILDSVGGCDAIDCSEYPAICEECCPKCSGDYPEEKFKYLWYPFFSPHHNLRARTLSHHFCPGRQFKHAISGTSTLKFMLQLYLNLTAIFLFPNHDTGRFLPDSSSILSTVSTATLCFSL